MNIQIENPRVRGIIILALVVAHVLALVGVVWFVRDLSTIGYSLALVGISANMLRIVNEKVRTHES